MASGFANHATQWWVDGPGATGNVLNGGGYDATVTNAGTNYADAASPIVTSTVGASNNSTTFTDAGNPFTNLMIGNVLRISAKSAGDTAALDYFMITAFTNSGSIVLDRAPTVTTGLTGATYRIGGRHPDLKQYAVGGSGTSQPTLASPLIAGNQVNIRGNGSLDSATIDYDMSNGYWDFPNGNNTASLSGGSIKWVGYNGRPNVGYCGLLGGTDSGPNFGNNYYIRHMKFTITVNSFPTHCIFDSGSASFFDCILDPKANDALVLGFGTGTLGGTNNVAASMVCNEVRNTGGGAAGTKAGVTHFHGGGFLFGNWIHGQRGDGIVGVGVFGSHLFNLINANGRYGFNDLENDGSRPIPYLLMNNTFDANGSLNFNLATMAALNDLMFNNIVSNVATGFTFVDTLALNTQRYRFINFNDYWTVTTVFSGSPAGWSLTPMADAGFTGNLSLNPTYTNSGSNDFTPTANVLNTAVAWVNTLTTTTYTLAMGAVQP